jgi:hypothetical protein
MPDLQPGDFDLVISEVRGAHLVWVFGTPRTQASFATALATLAFAHECARRSEVSIWFVEDDIAWLVKSYRPAEEPQPATHDDTLAPPRN